MSLIDWKEEYALGVAAIDHEHREMIALINDTYARMRDPHDAASVDHCLGEICASIASHFALEERMMRDAKYDEYEAHKNDHEDLLDQLRDLMDRFVEDPQSGRQLLQERLSNWFGSHFKTFDARLHRKLDIQVQ